MSIARKMTDVFIGYATEDRQVAERLANTLYEDGWEVFWDRRIEAGAEWNEDIQPALLNARCVLVLWSAASRIHLWHNAAKRSSEESPPLSTGIITKRIMTKSGFSGFTNV